MTDDRQMMYRQLRAENPTVRAADVWAFVNSAFDGAAMNLKQFLCRHDWSSGEDEETGGETSVYCLNCGADGDA